MATDDVQPQTALAGIRVLDFSRTVPGPMATTMLADLGADVIKVEEPGGGRRAREERQLRGEDEWTFTTPELRRRTLSVLERNKRSLAVDLRTDDGRAIAIELAKRSDVVVEGFRPGVMKRLGLDYDAIRKVNPRIVYCSVTGYGQTGPRADAVGHDLNFTADAGALSLIGDEGGRPIVPINLIADYAGGSYRAVVGILTALIARDRIGEGQYLDIAMADGVVSMLSEEVTSFVDTGEVPVAGKTRQTGAVAHQNVYQTKDGRWMSICCNEPYFFRALCEVLGTPELVEKQQLPLARQGELKQALQRKFGERTLDEWSALFSGRKSDIGFAPVRSIAEVVADDHYRARGMFVELETEHYGRITQVAPAVKLSRTPGRVRHAAPTPGQDSRAILRELGIDAAKIDKLYKERIVT